VALAKVLSSEEALHAARHARQSPRRRTHASCKFPANDINLLYVVPEAPTEASTLSRDVDEVNLSKSADALNSASGSLLAERRDRFSNRQRSIDELKVDTSYAIPCKVVKRPSLQDLHVYQNVRDQRFTGYTNIVIANTNNSSSSATKVPRKSSKVVYNQIDFAKTEALTNLRQHCMSERGIFPLPRC